MLWLTLQLCPHPEQRLCPGQWSRQLAFGPHALRTFSWPQPSPRRGWGGAALSGSLLLLCLRFPLAPSSQLCWPSPWSHLVEFLPWGLCGTFPVCLVTPWMWTVLPLFFFKKSFYLLTISYKHITHVLLPLNDISAQMLLSQRGLPCLPPWYYNIMLIMVCNMH